MHKRTRFHRGGGFHRVDFGRTLGGDMRTLAADGCWRPGTVQARDHAAGHPPAAPAGRQNDSAPEGAAGRAAGRVARERTDTGVDGQDRR